MQVSLLKVSNGACALFVNHRFIINGDDADDSGRLTETLAENLAAALQVGLTVTGIQTDDLPSDWSWESEYDRVGVRGVATPKDCQKCGSKLHSDGLCCDLTCPYSDWPQSVSLEDMHTLDADALCVKYGLIRAEAHSDDHVIEAPFEAHAWFVTASDADVLELVSEEWGYCEVADSVALDHETGPRLSLLFEYIHSKNAIQREIGFECSVNEDDAMAWLRRERAGLWARILCDKAGIRFSQAEEAEISGMWDWIGPHGGACDLSFESLDAAAIDAAQQQGLCSDPLPSPLYAAYWSTEAFHSPNGEDTRQIIGPSLVCEALGYSPDEINEVAALSVGQSWMSTDYGPAHTLRRIA